jgi:hypothetical protein
MGMSHRPLRYWGVRYVGERGRPSVWGSILLALFALFLTYMAVWVVIHPGPNNIPGDVILDVAFVSLAVWVDWLTIQRGRQLALATRKRSDSN